MDQPIFACQLSQKYETIEASITVDNYDTENDSIANGYSIGYVMIGAKHVCIHFNPFEYIIQRPQQ